MARGRLIAKSLSTSRKYAALQAVAGDLGEFCQMLYPLLVIHSDDYGRLPGDLFTVKHLIVPASPRTESDLGRALVHLDAVGLIQWYDHDGRKWIQIEQFDVHQVNLHKRTAPTSPAPPQTNGSPEIPGPPGNSGLRARAELNLTELNISTSTRADAPPHPVENSRPRKPKPNVKVLAAMILREGVLQIPRIPDQAEAAKVLAARHQLAYDSKAIAHALASAQTQAAKRREVVP